MQESSEKEVRESFCGTTGIFVARLLGKLLSGLNSCKIDILKERLQTGAVLHYYKKLCHF